MKSKIELKLVDFGIEEMESDYARMSWMLFEHEGVKYYLNACLENDSSNEKIAISKSDNGMNWGMCGDTNELAFDKFGEQVCRDFFYDNLPKWITIKD